MQSTWTPGTSTAVTQKCINCFLDLRGMVCRWERASAAIAEEQRFEREAAAQLAQPDSLPNADVAAALVKELLQRTAASGGVPCSQQLLQKVVERCADNGEPILHSQLLIDARMLC